MSTTLIKRAFDCLVSATALVVAAPCMALVALSVRLDSPGPVLFKQYRVGRYGKNFRILKFRTMVDQPSNPGAEITVHGDPRVTRSGSFLRQWKLDELPQLWNVLRGDMSIVGPRPEVPKYVALYPEHQRAIVLNVRPGITDEASVKYRSESDLLMGVDDPERLYREVILPDKLALAVDYAQAMSLRRDLSIIVQTLLKVLR